MNKIKMKPVIEVIGFVFLLFLATTIGNIGRGCPDDFVFISSITYNISIGIYIGLFFSWTIGVYTRIMQSHVRTYLMLIGASILLWVSIRAVKWGSIRFIPFGDRMAWYMYYIPMIMIPLLFFFTALCVGEDENYRPNKKWNLLFIPAILLILLVLTNDLHFLVFNGFDITIRQYGQKYGYGIGYYMVIAFIAILGVSSVFLIIKKFSKSAVSRRASRLPLLVVGCIMLYGLIYMLDSSYGIGYYFIDTTIFGCTAAIAFWEACIRTGLIHSNSRYKEFFETATTKAQILNNNGEAVYSAKNTEPLTKEMFSELKETQSVEYNKTTILNMTKITGGYVAWYSDVSLISSMIIELESLNEILYKEIDLLTVETKQKGENTRARKLDELQNIVLAETLPYSEKIKSDITTNKNTTLEEMKHLLFETSIISACLKRKVNLILIEQTEKNITTEEMKRAFLESAQLLKLYKRNCTINIIDKFNMSLGIAMACYDLYQIILEKSRYNFDMMYITLRKTEDNIFFTVNITSNVKLHYSDFENFKNQKLSQISGKLNFYNEEECNLVSITIPV